MVEFLCYVGSVISLWFGLSAFTLCNGITNLFKRSQPKIKLVLSTEEGEKMPMGRLFLTLKERNQFRNKIKETKHKHELGN